jgi:hypothetical protein
MINVIVIAMTYYFYSRNIWLLINSSVGIIKQFSIVLIITLALIMPFWTIVGFRFNTAFHIFLFGLLNYYIHNKKSYFSSACIVLEIINIQTRK